MTFKNFFHDGYDARHASKGHPEHERSAFSPETQAFGTWTKVKRLVDVLLVFCQ